MRENTPRQQSNAVAAKTLKTTPKKESTNSHRLPEFMAAERPQQTASSGSRCKRNGKAKRVAMKPTNRPASPLPLMQHHYLTTKCCTLHPRRHGAATSQPHPYHPHVEWTWKQLLQAHPHPDTHMNETPPLYPPHAPSCMTHFPTCNK